MPPDQGQPKPRHSILVYGPLPPPVGGTRVSFELIHDYLLNLDDVDVKLCDVPARSSITSGVDHFRTILALVRSIRDLASADRVLIAGSRNFCMGYGAILGCLGRILRRPTSVRFFGGRPFRAYLDAPRAIRPALAAALFLHQKLSVETQVGRREFPKALRHRIDVHHGYRPAAPALASVDVASLELRPTPVRFVYTGEISTAKGIDLLIEAAQDLLVAGESLEVHFYGAEIDVTVPALNGIVYHGTRDNQELRRQLASYDAFVFPTAARTEGHPGSLVEAIMAGLPIISSDLETIREIVDHGDSGILFPIGDGERLKASMSLMMNPETRQRMSTINRSRSSTFDAAGVLPTLIRDLGLLPSPESAG